MHGIFVVFLREIALTANQRAVLNEVMSSFGFLSRIQISDHPNQKEWALPNYVFYNPDAGVSIGMWNQIRGAVSAHVPGYFTILSCGGPEAIAWICEKGEA